MERIKLLRTPFYKIAELVIIEIKCDSSFPIIITTHNLELKLTS